MQDKLIRIYSVKLREPSFAVVQNFNKIKASIPFTWHLPQMIKRRKFIMRMKHSVMIVAI